MRVIWEIFREKVKVSTLKLRANLCIVTLTYFLNSFVYKKLEQNVQIFGFYGFAKLHLYEMALCKTTYINKAVKSLSYLKVF